MSCFEIKVINWFPGEELTITKIESEKPIEEEVNIKVENSDSTILKSLGNGVFLDPTSNKRLKLDTLKNRSKKSKPSVG